MFMGPIFLSIFPPRNRFSSSLSDLSHIANLFSLIKMAHPSDKSSRRGPRGLRAVGKSAANRPPPEGRDLRVRGTIEEEKTSVCGSGSNGRILKYDYSGRS